MKYFLPCTKHIGKIGSLLVMLFLTNQVIAQCPIICTASASVELDVNGVATVTPSDLSQGGLPNCSGTFTVSIADTLGNNYGDTVDGSLLDIYLIATLTHSDGNFCNTILTAVDNMPPEVIASELFTYCNINTNPAIIGFPSISDNATAFNDLAISYSDNFTDLPCGSTAGDSTVTAHIKRTWAVTDLAGNTTIDTQNIWLLRATLNQVVFPLNFDGFDQPQLECGVDDPYDLNTTGYPTINNYPLTGASDCELVTAFTDQEFPECDGKIKIIRTWFVNDICTNQTAVDAQIIWVHDTQAPAITCPADIAFNTYSNSCLAQVFLPTATATDACSAPSIQPSWTFGNGHGPYNTVQAGSYDVTYTATDDCGNQSACTITVSVEDNVPPTPICENEVDVVLQADGTVLVFAETFDDGSHDNCEIDHFLASRNGDPFDEFVYFDCNDIGTPAEVTLKVFDANGLSTECTSDVIVVDEVDPVISCPGDVTVDCGFDYGNVEFTGVAFATDNCGINVVSHSDQINLNTCGIGNVVRTFVATDGSSNTDNCQQTIYIEDGSPLQVTFPTDILTYECGFDTDTSNTGVPILVGNDCEQLGISSTDFTFYTAYPACYKIVRNWAVIDWCVFQPNDPNGQGIWEHTQIIEILDSTAPELTCPDETTVGINNAYDCETYVQLDPATAIDCSENITILNDSPYADANGADASGTYPMGTHTVTFTAFDGCGNTDECSMIFKVVDAEAPAPVCNNGVSVTIQTNGMVTITPNLIEGGSSDNCSDYDDLIFQVSPNTFTCQDIGNQTVTLTVTDIYDNSSFCQTTVVVQDNLDYCNNLNNDVAIGGFVGTEDGEALVQKLVGISGGISIAQHTDIDGSFLFDNLPSGSSYTITPTYDTNPLNGVTTLDIVVLRKHVLNINKINTPYRLIAADVNQSGSITTLDLVQIRKLILHNIPNFSNNTSWKFVPADYEFSDPENPWNDNFPESITLQNVYSNNWENDFIGIKIGDVNGSVNPANLLAADDRNAPETLDLMTPDRYLEAGYDYALPIHANNFDQIIGYQFALKLNTDYLEITDIIPGDLVDMNAGNFGTQLLDQGIITTAFENIFDQPLTPEEVLFTLRVRAKADTPLSDIMNIERTMLPVEAYQGTFASAATEVAYRDITLGFKKTTDTRLELYQNQPNPVNDFTTIPFYLSSAQGVELAVYDVTGKLLHQQNGHFTEGQHSIRLNIADLTTRAGVLIYELAVDGFRAQRRKMVFVK